MNYDLWAEWSNLDEENAEDAEVIIEAFNHAINGLLILEDSSFIFNTFNNSELEKQAYEDLFFNPTAPINLSEQLEKLRSILIGGALNWEEIRRSLVE